MSHRALFVFTNVQKMEGLSRPTGFNLEEAANLVLPLFDAGWEIEFASPLGGECVADPVSYDRSDPLSQRFVREKWLAKLKATKSLVGMNDPDIDALVLVGGFGAVVDFPGNPQLERLVLSVHDRGRIVAAVCHGPAGLLTSRRKDGSWFVSGMELCSITAAEEEEIGVSSKLPIVLEMELRKRGAKFIGGDPWLPHVLRSRSLLTGQNPKSARALSLAIRDGLVPKV